MGYGGNGQPCPRCSSRTGSASLRAPEVLAAEREIADLTATAIEAFNEIEALGADLSRAARRQAVEAALYGVQAVQRFVGDPDSIDRPLVTEFSRRGPAIIMRDSVQFQSTEPWAAENRSTEAAELAAALTGNQSAKPL